MADKSESEYAGSSSASGTEDPPFAQEIITRDSLTGSYIIQAPRGFELPEGWSVKDKDELHFEDKKGRVGNTRALFRKFYSSNSEPQANPPRIIIAPTPVSSNNRRKLSQDPASDQNEGTSRRRPRTKKIMTKPKVTKKTNLETREGGSTLHTSIDDEMSDRQTSPEPIPSTTLFSGTHTSRSFEPLSTGSCPPNRSFLSAPANFEQRRSFEPLSTGSCPPNRSFLSAPANSEQSRSSMTHQSAALHSYDEKAGARIDAAAFNAGIAAALAENYTVIDLATQIQGQKLIQLAEKQATYLMRAFDLLATYNTKGTPDKASQLWCEVCSQEFQSNIDDAKETFGYIPGSKLMIPKTQRP